jgi:hypothetical protein
VGPGGGLDEPTSNMLEQGSLTSVGLDRKTKKRRPLPMQPEPMMDPMNTLAQMAMQRPMMGSDPTEVDPEGVMKRKMTYG